MRNSVYWILAAIFLLVAITQPRLRVPGIVGCVVMGLLLSWGMLQRLRSPSAADPLAPKRGLPSSPGVAVSTFPIEAINLTELKMTGGGAPFDVRGRIANQSHDQRLISIKLQITRRDCFEGALDPSGCITLFQDRRFIPVAIAPQEEREFAASFFAHGSAMRPRGTTRDEFTLLSAEGEATK
jgi:hypothetical protein